MNRQGLIKTLIIAALLGILLPIIHSVYFYITEESELFASVLSVVLSVDQVYIPMLAIIHFLPLYILIALSADCVYDDLKIAEVYVITRAGRRIDWALKGITRLFLLSGAYYCVMIAFTVPWFFIFGCRTVSTLRLQEFFHALLFGIPLYTAAILIANWASLLIGRTYATILVITLIIGLTLLAHSTMRPVHITVFALNPVARSFYNWSAQFDLSQVRENILSNDLLYWGILTVGLAFAMGRYMQRMDLCVAK